MLILTSSLFATLYMTGASYILSRLCDTNFREPELLQALLFKHDSGIPSTNQIVISWLLHFIIGYVLAAMLYGIWYYQFWSPTWISAVLLGLCTGFLGVAGWSISFYLKSDRTMTNYLSFYTQLVAVHVLFGLVVFAVFKLW